MNKLSDDMKEEYVTLKNDLNTLNIDSIRRVMNASDFKQYLKLIITQRKNNTLPFDAYNTIKNSNNEEKLKVLADWLGLPIVKQQPQQQYQEQEQYHDQS